ncbi:MAG: peptide MFS transporter [Planctomycetaceae bacterium]|nr:peptide MFS transporter [Planctomycetaceae bacterium]
MAQAGAGFVQQVKSLPRTFYVANTMEIFERMAWYGMFTPLALYLTDKRARGGLEFTEEDAGTIIGIVTFALYLMPVITGALGDRFGYKKMFLIAYAILTPAYYMLGTFTSYGTFLMGFLFVAVGAAIFKPVVVGTIARVTNEQTSQLGFGIFYMMVNVGGFLGPAISGFLRSPDPETGISHWNRLFLCSSIFIAINFIWVICFYQEPTTESTSATRRTLGKVLRDAMEVLGNVRFFICVLGMLIVFFAAGKSWLTWTHAGLAAAAWLAGNLIFDAVLRVGNPTPGSVDRRPWLLKPMQVSNWRFAVYLLILSGFWTAFNQILGGVPLVKYIQDFVQTRPLLDFLAAVLGAVGLSGWSQGITDYVARGGQFNPEWISNLDALFIVIFQIAISLIVTRIGRFPGMITGIIIAGIGISLPALSGGGTVGMLHASGWLVVLAVFCFSIGEMMASPTSQEYIGSIAPKDKVALYMGYYFIAVALGNLFGNVLGGIVYGKLARDLGRPDLMWVVFGVMAFITALALALYNRYAVPRPTVEAG